MKKVKVPYGRGMLSAEVDDARLVGVFESALPEAAPDERAEVERALNDPIGSPRLEELARGKRSAVVIAMI